jgi:hypothetical protein
VRACPGPTNQQPGLLTVLLGVGVGVALHPQQAVGREGSTESNKQGRGRHRVTTRFYKTVSQKATSV